VIVLLRAVNVGGTGKLPMALLRAALTDAGLKDVRTYIQSGNIVCGSKLSPIRLAELVRKTIMSEFDLDVPTVALTADELAEAIDQWPVPAGASPKALHCVVFDAKVTAERMKLITSYVTQAQAAGSEDHAEVSGRFVYLHTPGGAGESKLARQLSSPRLGGTARNWNTANTLLEMARNGP